MCLWTPDKGPFKYDITSREGVGGGPEKSLKSVRSIYQNVRIAGWGGGSEKKSVISYLNSPKANSMGSIEYVCVKEISC